MRHKWLLDAEHQPRYTSRGSVQEKLDGIVNVKGSVSLNAAVSMLEASYGGIVFFQDLHVLVTETED